VGWTAWLFCNALASIENQLQWRATGKLTRLTSYLWLLGS
jgi:hypothetical protein